MPDHLTSPCYLFNPGIPRRSLLAGLAAAGGALALGNRAIAAPEGARLLSELGNEEAEANGHIRYTHLQFDDPVEKMRTKVRLEFGTADGTYVWWYTFVLFAIMPGQSPVRLIRFEGMEMSEWRTSGENEYLVHGHNVSFPQDYETGAFLSRWKNPITGRILDTQPTLLTSDTGRRKTPNGDYDLSDEAAGLRPEGTVFRVEGDLIHKDDVRNPPEDWPGQFIETNTVTGSLEHLVKTDQPSIPARGSGMWVQPYLRWMQMPKDKGFMVGYFSGRKMKGVSHLPKPFHDRLLGNHPELARVDPTKFTGEYWEQNASGLLNTE